MKKLLFIFILVLMVMINFGTSKSKATDDFSDYYTVIDYGANGSDMEDDTLEIQNALNIAAYELKSGTGNYVEVYVPDGTYYIDDALKIYSNTHLVLSKNASIVSSTGKSSLLVANHLDDNGNICTGKACNHGGYTQWNNITIEGGQWNNNSDPSTNYNGFVLRHGQNLTIKNITYINSSGHALNISGTKDALLQNVLIKDQISSEPKKSDSNNEVIHIDTITLEGEGSAYPLDGTPVKNVTIENCIFENVLCGIGSHVAIMDENQMGDNIIIRNNIFNNVTCYAINLFAHKNVKVYDNVATGCNNSNFISDSNEAFAFIRAGYTEADIKDNQVSNFEKTLINYYDDSPYQITCDDDNISDKYYIMTFNGNGGSGEMPYIIVKFYEKTQIPENQFKRTGYKFIGWNAFKNNPSEKKYRCVEKVNGNTWFTEEEIIANNYNKYLFTSSVLKTNSLHHGETIMFAVWKEIDSIQVIQSPTKKDYFINGESLDLSGGKLKILYKDQTEEIIDLTNKDVIVTGFDNSKLGTDSLLVEYCGLTTSFDVNISQMNYSVNGNGFSTLKDAYHFISENEGIIKVEQSNEDESTLTIDTGKKIIIDTNGKEITIVKNKITNCGDLKIIGNGTITTLEKNSLPGVIENKEGGRLELSNATIQNKGKSSGTYYGILARGGDVFINGGNVIIKNKMSDNGYALFVKSANVVINAGSLYSAKGYGIYGISNSSGKASGNIIIKGGEVLGEDSYGIYFDGTKNSSSQIIYECDMELYVSEEKAQKVNISGIFYGEYTQGNIFISSGKVATDNLVAIQNGGTGTVVIGEKSGEVSADSPIIQGKNGVIDSKNTFYFYDGILKYKEDVLDKELLKFMEKEESCRLVEKNEVIDGENYKTLSLIKEYDILITVGANGKVTPEICKVPSGSTQKYNIIPESGYEIEKVLIDGEDKGKIVEYTFKNIMENHTINVEFSKINETSGEEQKDNSGETIEENVKESEEKNSDGKSNGSSGGSSSGGSSAAAAQTYEITVIQATGGTISPTTLLVKKGLKQKFVIMPDKGYQIKDVIIDEKSIGIQKEYTFENITKKHTITAKFEKIINVDTSGDRDTSSNASIVITNFEDLSHDAWYYEGVKYVVENKVFNGMSATKFGPNISMTRAMFVTVLYRLNGAIETKNSSFNDVDKDSYYSKAIAWASKMGIVNGIGDNNFAPNREISREELATIIVRYLNRFHITIEYVKGNTEAYIDLDKISIFALESVKLLQETGLMMGKEENRFDPKGLTTRAEVATLLMRLDKKMKYINEIEQ